MAQAEVGALRIRLGMEIAELKEGVKNAIGDMEKLKKAAQVAGIAIGAALAAGFAAVSASVIKALGDLDEFSKLSSKIGVPVDQLTGLAHAADLSGVSIEALGTAFKKMSQNMQDVASGDITSEAARSFAALGIAVTDAGGAMRSTNDVFADVAEKFAGMQDGASKTAIAVALFGKAGADLIPLLNSGSTGLKDMADEADKLGLVVGKDAAVASERFNDALSKLGSVFTGIGRQLVSELGPAFALLVEKFVDVVKEGDLVKTIAKGIGDTFKGAVELALRFAHGMEVAWLSVQEFAHRVANAFTITAEDITNRNREFAARLSKIHGDLNYDIQNMWNGTSEQQQAAATTYNEKVAAPIIQGTNAIAEAKRLLNEEEREWMRLVNEGVKLAEATRSPQEILADKAKALDAALYENRISAQQFGAAMQKATMVSLNAYAGMASGIANNLATAFGESKAFAIAAAIVNTAESITKTLATYGATPWGIAAAAAAAAAGAAQIAAIRSTNKGGGGGGGGSASVAAAAANTQAAAPAQQQGVFITLQGEKFGREQVRGLIEQINEAVDDGAVIRVAA